MQARSRIDDGAVMDEDVHEFEALTALQLQQLMGDGVSTVVVPFGSVEHHGGHLPLGADALLADPVRKECSRRLGAVLAPSFRIGCSDRHADLAGTPTLRPETLTAVATQTAQALARQGFTVIALVSTHGGTGPRWRRPWPNSPGCCQVLSSALRQATSARARKPIPDRG